MDPETTQGVYRDKTVASIYFFYIFLSPEAKYHTKGYTFIPKYRPLNPVSKNLLKVSKITLE